VEIIKIFDIKPESPYSSIGRATDL